MKITFEGVTRALDLDRNITLRSGAAIYEFTGLTVYAWQERVTGISAADYIGDAAGADPAALAALVKRSPMFTDPEWLKTMAAAHWLMLTQAGEDAPELSIDYPVDVVGFHLAFLTALVEEAQAKAAPDQPGPTVSPARRTPSSRRTAAPGKPKAPASPSGALPRLTGS